MKRWATGRAWRVSGASNTLALRLLYDTARQARAMDVAIANRSRVGSVVAMLALMERGGRGAMRVEKIDPGSLPSVCMIFSTQSPKDPHT